MINFCSFLIIHTFYDVSNKSRSLSIGMWISMDLPWIDYHLSPLNWWASVSPELVNVYKREIKVPVVYGVGLSSYRLGFQCITPISTTLIFPFMANAYSSNVGRVAVNTINAPYWLKRISVLPLKYRVCLPVFPIWDAVCLVWTSSMITPASCSLRLIAMCVWSQHYKSGGRNGWLYLLHFYQSIWWLQQ